MSFTDKYYHTTKLHKSYVCLGLDTDMDQMPKFLLDYQNPIWEFNRQIIGSTKNLVAAYKLNFAFYLANGLAGIDALSKTITAIPDYIPVILDVKVGDIANTMKHYGKAFFDLMKVDSITVNPLMGEDVITPLLPYKDKFFFVLALTSNRSATDFLKHRNLYKDISKKIERWGHKQIGAVVGATNSAQLKEVRSLMPETIFLIPGIGALKSQPMSSMNGRAPSSWVLRGIPM